MKLYNLDHSPYSTRVRMQIRKKGLDIAIEAPPVPLRSPEYAQRFPLAKIPVLELDDGSCLPDSWIIMEFLEDRYPESALRPSGSLGRAQMGLLARCADTCFGPGALSLMFARLMAPGGTENPEDLLAALGVELARLERLLSSGLPDFRLREVHLGDIALVPHIAYLQIIAPAFGLSDPLANYPEVSRWWDWVQEDDVINSTTDEMRVAFQAFADSKS